MLTDFGLYSKECRVIHDYPPIRVLERETFVNALVPHGEADQSVILEGDFNCACEASDRGGTMVYPDCRARILQVILDEYSLVDVSHLEVNTGTLKYTRFQGSKHGGVHRIYTSVTFPNNIFKGIFAPASLSFTTSLHSK